MTGLVNLLKDGLKDGRFDKEEEPVAVRMIHAAGLVELAPSIHFSAGFAVAGRRALANGAAILCDAHMVSEGVTRARLPTDNPVICTLRDPSVPDLAKQMGTTRSAAALELWRPHLAGALVAIAGGRRERVGGARALSQRRGLRTRRHRGRHPRARPQPRLEATS